MGYTVIRTLALSSVLVLSSAFAATTLDSEVITAMNRNEVVTVIAHFDRQLDLNSLKLPADHSARAEKLSAALERFNQNSLKPVRALAAANGVEVKEITPIWITNSARIVASSAFVQRLASANGIQSIELDKARLVDMGEPAKEITSNRVEEIAWGVEKVRAPEMWKKGFNGKGVLVAVVDTGVTVKHPDLLPVMWKNPGEQGLDSEGKDKATNGKDDDGNGFVDDVYGWNFEEGKADVTDNFGHGTPVAGIIAGLGLGVTKTGIAPGAQIMALRTANSFAQWETKTWLAFEYAIKMKARVINMSMRHFHNQKPNYLKWRRLGEVLLAANIVHVNAAGNEGSYDTPYNISAPPSNPPAWSHPSQTQKGGLTSMIAVGATDEKDGIRSYSSVGPITWEFVEEYKDYPLGEKKIGLVKPEICAPSEVTTTSHKGEGYYANFNGTSSASPHAAGVVALLLSAKPNLTVAQVTEALMMSAVPYKDGFGNVCGAGRIDAVKALEYAAKWQ